MAKWVRKTKKDLEIIKIIGKNKLGNANGNVLVMPKTLI